MPAEEIDVRLVTPAGIERVVRYLPAFMEPDRTFGEEVSGKMVGPREIELGGGGPGEVEQSFVDACYAENLVQSFDWMAWVQEDPEIAGSLEFIRAADLRSVIMLLTTHIRGDRFSSGHLVDAFRDGVITEIVMRLSQLHSGDGDRAATTLRTAANDRDVIREHIRIEEDDTSVTIKVNEINWSGPYRAVSTWVDAAVIPTGSSTRARDFAVRRVLNSLTYFQICAQCGERYPLGQIVIEPYDGGHDVCHDCAQRDGVVF